MPTDFETVRARHSRRRAHPSHECPDQPQIGDDIQFLIEELTAARATVERMTGDDEDLRASADIWCRLYEAALDRASAAEAALARSGSELPGQMRALYEALARVADLTNALGTVIRDCAICARGTSPSDAITKVATEACVRCTKALEALARRAR